MQRITISKLRQWLCDAHSSVAAEVPCLGDRTNWWPGDGSLKKGKEQGWFSTWFLTAAALGASELISTPTAGEAVFLNKCGPHLDQKPHQPKLLASVWSKDRPAYRVQRSEMLVDLTVTSWTQSQPVLFSAELEASKNQSVSDVLTAFAKPDARKTLDKLYAWDVVKLLLLPSPLRLFIARVGTTGGVTAEARMDELSKTCETLLHRHAKLFEQADEVGIILVPDDRNSWRQKTRLAVMCGNQLTRHVGLDAA